MLTLGGRARGLRSERGQALILFVGVFTVVLVVAVIVVDVGLWLAERRSVQRAADLAAAAAAQDLPQDGSAAISAAYDWADKNGFASGVTVELLCKNTLPAGGPLCTNQANPPGPDPCAPSERCDAVRVTISKPGALLFASIFGIGDVDVGAVASAGLAANPVAPAEQTIILLDAQGRMGDACGSNPPECPISNAKIAANQLVDVIFSSGPGVRVGYAPYHNCYGPSGGCVPESLVIGPVVNPIALHSRIGDTTDHQLEPANVCLPLWKAKQLFDAAPASPRRVVVLLSDGGNRYQHTPPPHTHPPAECHPDATDALPPPLQEGACAGARPAWSELDVLTRAMSNTLKSQRVEIYVIGLRVCGTPSSTPSTPSYCAGIGNGDHDNVADRRLLKCIASSKTNTNDHYIEVSTPSALPDAYEQIAEAVIGRGLIQ